MSVKDTETFSRRGPVACALVALTGAGVLAGGLWADPTRVFSSLLCAGFLAVSIGVGALFLLALFYVGHSGWSSVLKRILEALSLSLPWTSLLLLATLPGMSALYSWVRKPGHSAQAVYLQPSLFAGRMIGILGLWCLFSFLLRRNSRLEDQSGELEPHRRNVALSAGFLVVFALSFSVASFDWLMSLEPHWASTIFALYNIAGALVAATATITIVAIALKRSGRLAQVTAHHLHDLGKLLLAFSSLWAYLWLSQFLLIWYANLPEETVHYVRRWQGGYTLLFWLNVAFGWALPFFALLPRPAKRSETHLLWVSSTLLLGRWLDLYLLAAPATSEDHVGIGGIELGALALAAGVLGLATVRALARAPLIPRFDPYLEEALHHEQ